MVLYEEGREKNPSSHLVKAFGDQKPRKMGRCDLNRIIILFSIHLDAFKVETPEELAYNNSFVDRI